MTQYASKEMQCWPIGKEVGNVLNQGAQLIERFQSA